MELDSLCLVFLLVLKYLEVLKDDEQVMELLTFSGLLEENFGFTTFSVVL